jgi:hypothetical protein
MRTEQEDKLEELQYNLETRSKRKTVVKSEDTSGSNSAGRVPPCQGGCREFESLLPLHRIPSQLEKGFFCLRCYIISMDISKRNNLINALSTQPEPRIIEIEEFFEGNDDIASIGCNLIEHPGIEQFGNTFARIAKRSDVSAIYAKISDLNLGDDESWPFADTVFVVGTISASELASELVKLEPDEVSEEGDLGILERVGRSAFTHVLAVWWD